jgi:hypothetical protein
MSSLKQFLKNIILSLPYLSSIKKELEIYRTHVPPGHYYSPVINVKEIKKYEEKLYNRTPESFKGIQFNQQDQFALIKELKAYYKAFENYIFTENNRFKIDNTYFGYTDAIMLFCLIRHFKPKQIVEVGSGYSSVLMLDVSHLYFKKSITFNLIEPFPERLNSLLNIEEKETVNILQQNVQEIDFQLFSQLNENDILFIDSSHVSKTGSDLNYLLFDVLPGLKPGVIVHFHDIFYPFEYPKEWVYSIKGFGWNEIYSLHSFLMYNSGFEILLFNDFAVKYNLEWIRTHMPLCTNNFGGSMWLRVNK